MCGVYVCVPLCVCKNTQKVISIVLILNFVLGLEIQENSIVSSSVMMVLFYQVINPGLLTCSGSRIFENYGAS